MSRLDASLSSLHVLGRLDACAKLCSEGQLLRRLRKRMVTRFFVHSMLSSSFRRNIRAVFWLCGRWEGASSLPGEAKLIVLSFLEPVSVASWIAYPPMEPAHNDPVLPHHRGHYWQRVFQAHNFEGTGRPASVRSEQVRLRVWSEVLLMQQDILCEMALEQQVARCLHTLARVL
jgi:hypothetical protein